MLIATLMWTCSALNTGTGQLYYAHHEVRRTAERHANQLCEAYADPSDPHGCFTYKCEQKEVKPACVQLDPQHVVCEIDPNDDGWHP